MKNFPGEWTKYKYFDPEVVLPKLQGVRIALTNSDTPDRIRNLRTNPLGGLRENWDAAIFCQLLRLALGLEIYFSVEEASDFDSIFTWTVGSTQFYSPIQLKELVPKKTNSDATLRSIIHSLKKYKDSHDLIVGIKLNREERIDFSELDFSGVGVSEIWCFGATKPDESEWCLVGDLLAGGKQYTLSWPHT